MDAGMSSDRPGSVLWLAPDERQWLAQTMSLPRAREGGEELSGESDPRATAARRFRALLLAVFLDASDEDIPVALTADELWLLDMHLMQYDLRDSKLPSGRLLSDFARKVWGQLTEIHQDELPRSLQKGTRNARANSDTDESADAIAAAEALLRPSEDAGTG
ncbi:MAG: hypothetical protein R3B59_05280 [Dehalococcoidia bacterium]